MCNRCRLNCSIFRFSKDGSRTGTKTAQETNERLTHRNVLRLTQCEKIVRIAIEVSNNTRARAIVIRIEHATSISSQNKQHCISVSCYICMIVALSFLVDSDCDSCTQIIVTHPSPTAGHMLTITIYIVTS